MSDYQRDDVAVPKVAGFALRALARTLESPLGGAVAERLLVGSGLQKFRDEPAGHASAIQLTLPALDGPSPATPDGGWLQAALATAPNGDDRETAAAFARGYAAGTVDANAVATRACAAVEQLHGGDATLAILIAHRRDEVLAAAAESTRRWREGRPRSPLDGVPVVIKDELDVAGYPTTLGTKLRGDEVATQDAVVVARLRAAGAVILGKANMNEIGINPLGGNPHHGQARNPYQRGHNTGGSSSGSGAAVASGLCPIAIGADGGGSIRIPAALCGVVGLKATLGRVPETGVPPLCWNVAHVGPIGLTVADVAAAYAIIAGPDAGDHMTLGHQAPHLARLADDDLRGVRIGICRPYFDDATDDIVTSCHAAVAVLVARGAVIVELPPPDLNTILWSHAIIILSEMAAAMAPLREHLGDFALNSRTNLAFGRHFRATDLVHAMRHRHQLTVDTLAQLRDVDVIATPTTAITAPVIDEATLPAGDSNLPVVDQLMSFVRVANLTGLPALSVPCGVDRAGLPIGLQLMGRAWDEATLLRLGRVVEAATPYVRPTHHVRLLGR